MTRRCTCSRWLVVLFSAGCVPHRGPALLQGLEIGTLARLAGRVLGKGRDRDSSQMAA